MKKALLTGVSGLLGSSLLRRFANHYEATGTAFRFQLKEKSPPIFNLDLTDEKKATDLVKKVSPDLVIHSAAAVNLDQCEKDRAFAHKTNVLQTRYLAAAAKECGARFVYISTDAFFDGPEGKTFSELDPPTPMSCYSETKLEAEKIVSTIFNDALIIRTNLYGWNVQPKQSLAEWMLSNFQDRKKIPLVKDVFYTPIFTDVLSEIIFKLVDKKISGVMHAASDRSISKLEFGRLLCKEFGLSEDFIEEVSIASLPLNAKRSKNMSLNVSRLKSVLPEISLKVEDHLRLFRNSRPAKT